MDDHISELPDDVLSYILTMLSIKDLLKTSVLSKRWCKLWGLRKDLYFDIHNVLGNENELLQTGHLTDVTLHSRRCVNLDLSPKEFIKRVDQFINNFSGTIIDSFWINFYFDCEQSNIIDQWISFAIARGVKRINLLFGGRTYSKSTKNKYYKFDSALFSETALTLKHLSLENFLVCYSTNRDITPFKHLRSLSLLHVKVDEIFIESLLSSCRRLEKLYLVGCEFKSSIPKIVSSSLYHLSVSSCYKVSNNNVIRFIRLMSVDCLKLTSLECCGSDLSTMNIYTHVLKSINFSISNDMDLDAFALCASFDLCATFPELEIMRLEIYTMVAASPKIAQPLKYLKQLDCIVHLLFYPIDEDEEFFDPIDEECDLMMILNILQACPLLQKLSVTIAEPSHVEKQKVIRDVEVFSHDEIKVIEFRGCVGNWFEIEFVMNVLKYAHKLEQIVVSPYCKEDDPLNWNSDPLWFQSGRERMMEKLQSEEVVGREKLVFI